MGKGIISMLLSVSLLAGISLKDDTALLVTVTKHRFSDGYESISEQYEFDSEGRRLQYTDCRALLYKNYEWEYDENGNLLKKSDYEAYWKDDTRKLKGWTEYGYEEAKNGGVSRTEREYNGDGSLCREAVYDGRDRLLSEKKYSENMLYSEYEYDSPANESWRTIYDSRGRLLSRHQEQYDSAGNRTLHAEYDAEGNLNVFRGYECDTYVVIYPYWRYENTYDSRGNLIRQVQYSHEGEETEVREYEYDNAGNTVRTFFSDEMVTEEVKYSWEYDDAGNQIKKTITEYEYDDEGNLVSDRTGIVWERKYDNRNRLVELTEYSGGKPECRYDYRYILFGVSEKDYPYDRCVF